MARLLELIKMRKVQVMLFVQVVGERGIPIISSPSQPGRGYLDWVVGLQITEHFRHLWTFL